MSADTGGSDPHGEGGRVPPPPATSIDPGREMPPPGTDGPRAAGVGHGGPGDGGVPATVIDPGRGEDPQLAEWSAPGMPAAFRDRFEPVDELRRGGQARLFLVHHAAHGHAVLKIYEPGKGPSAEVLAYLAYHGGHEGNPHLVRVYEAGRLNGFDYELMEHLPSRSVAELAAGRERGALSTEEITAIVRQTALALQQMHAHRIVHRDVKPANMLVRRNDPGGGQPLETALGDFGISMHVPGARTRSVTTSGTTRYVPPEYASRALEVSPASDWWALGMSALELHLGTHPFDGMRDESIFLHLARGPLDLSKVADPRVLLLCRGLLNSNSRLRWSARQVLAWADGEDPEVRGAASPSPAPPAPDLPSYLFQGRPYTDKALLAVEMAANWTFTANLLFGKRGRPARELADWINRLDEPSPERDAVRGLLRRRPGPADVALLRLLRYLDPGGRPVYRDTNLTVRGVAAFAYDAWRAPQSTVDSILGELWHHRLLRLLPTRDADEGLIGLDGIDEAWRRHADDWAVAVANIDDAGAREFMAGRAERDRLAATLWIAACRADTLPLLRGQLHAGLADVERRLGAEVSGRLPWFDRLRRPGAAAVELAVACVLVPFVGPLLLREAAEEQQARSRRRWLLEHGEMRAQVERLERHTARAWAGAGAGAAAAVWVMLLGLSEIAEVADLAAMQRAWIVTGLSVSLVLTLELVLASFMGGLYWPRYSLLHQSIVHLGRVARRVRGREMWSLGIVVLALALTAAVTVYVPMAIPLVTALGLLAWAPVRLRRWQADRRAMQHELRLAEYEREEDRMNDNADGMAHLDRAEVAA
ncbi:hypothetical protein CS0771_03380 [Catellatospora sp. IY07-71]|nr:hypothetical protein CS0771_03380 [Catellatospora sp. IY07-71]